MPLTAEHVDQLREAILSYSFPAVYYDFHRNREVKASGMAEVENIIGVQLRSANGENVKHGLANILYWGYANVGFRDTRVEDLNNNVTTRQIENFQALLADTCVPTMAEVKSIHIPQYSGMSFLSKVLMFLNPKD